MKTYNNFLNETILQDLWSALKNDDFNFIKKYSEDNSLNITSRNITPLINACINRNFNMVSFLIEKCDVDINFKDPVNKYNALATSIYYNIPKMIKLLIDYGANLDIETNYNSPINLMVIGNISKKMIKFLFDSGIEYDFVFMNKKFHLKYFHVVKDYDFDFSIKHDGEDIFSRLSDDIINDFKLEYPEKWKKYISGKKAKKFKI